MVSREGSSPWSMAGAKQAAKTVMTEMVIIADLWNGQKGVGKRSLYLRSSKDNPMPVESITLIA